MGIKGASESIGSSKKRRPVSLNLAVAGVAVNIIAAVAVEMELDPNQAAEGVPSRNAQQTPLLHPVAKRSIIVPTLLPLDLDTHRAAAPQQDIHMALDLDLLGPKACLQQVTLHLMACHRLDTGQPQATLIHLQATPMLHMERHTGMFPPRTVGALLDILWLHKVRLDPCILDRLAWRLLFIWEPQRIGSRNS